MLFKIGEQYIEININDYSNDLFYYEKILKLKSKNKNQDLKPDQINEIKKMIKLIK
tara:strand:- start:812 stop:979 length:168 start_codon:yes stop_codon:yes gene_type:complete